MCEKRMIKNYNDFLSYHSDGSKIYWCYDRLQYGLCLLCGIQNKYRFESEKVRDEIEHKIRSEWNNSFDVEETRGFYYPNDNMFSGNNAVYDIPGFILTLKK